MELKFIGRGGAFNTDEGNTSAFLKNNKGQMLLIDCGEAVFKEIKDKHIIDDVKELFVIITHTHCDHIGSLGSFVLFCWLVKQLKVSLVLSDNEDYNEVLKYMLLKMGVDDDSINYISTEEFSAKFEGINSVKFLPTEHVKEFDSFGLEFGTDKGLVYYSGDTNTTKYLEKYINLDTIHKIYIETCNANHEGNFHLFYGKIFALVPREKAHLIYAMHLDTVDIIPILKEYGINVVEKI